LSTFSLDAIDPLVVLTFTGFDLPDDITTVGILGDGTSDFNAVLQSAGTGLPEAEVTGISFSLAEIATLRALRQAEAPVTFVEPEGTHTVVIRRFQTGANNAGLERPWSMTLVELPAEGS